MSGFWFTLLNWRPSESSESSVSFSKASGKVVESLLPSMQTYHKRNVQNPYDILLYADWFIGIFIMDYYNPCKTAL